MSDLVQQLREVTHNAHILDICLKAADRIEQLGAYILTLVERLADYDGRIEALEEECQLLSKRHQEADVALAGYETRIEALEAALRLGVTMRAQQIRYFKNKCREQLIASKDAEKAFDEAARRALDGKT